MHDRTLAIFGITGQTGRVLAGVAAERGWRVRGLVRPQSLHTAGVRGATLVAGHFSDSARLVEVMAGAAATCCVLGPRPPFTDVFCADAVDAIVGAMRAAGVRRLVCQTGAMIGSGHRTLPFRWLSTWIGRRQPAVMADRVEQERRVASSGLDWTLVKPPRLTNAPGREALAVGPDLRMGLFSHIGRTSLAHFLLDAVDREDLFGARVFVKA